MHVEPEPLLRGPARGRSGRRRRRRRSSAPRSRPGSSRFGCSTGIPRRSAASLAGDGRCLRPLPAGASGRVRTQLTRGPRPAAAGRRRRTPRSQRPRAGGSTCAEDGLRPELRQSRAPRLVVGAVDDQHAVEVIELVLDDARRRELELEPDRLALRVESLDRDRRRTLHGNEHFAEGEAPLVVDLFVPSSSS